MLEFFMWVNRSCYMLVNATNSSKNVVLPLLHRFVTRQPMVFLDCIINFSDIMFNLRRSLYKNQQWLHYSCSKVSY